MKNVRFKEYGKNINFEQPLIISFLKISLLVFHFEISGKYDILEKANIKSILTTLFVFHLEISGSEDNEEHLKNIELILSTLQVSHFEISGNDCHFSHCENI